MVNCPFSDFFSFFFCCVLFFLVLRRTLCAFSTVQCQYCEFLPQYAVLICYSNKCYTFLQMLLSLFFLSYFHLFLQNCEKLKKKMLNFEKKFLPPLAHSRMSYLIFTEYSNTGHSQIDSTVQQYSTVFVLTVQYYDPKITVTEQL